MSTEARTAGEVETELQVVSTKKGDSLSSLSPFRAGGGLRRALRRGRESAFVFAEDADVGEVAVELVGVHAVADEEFRRGAESVPVCLRLFPFGRDVLVDQDAGAAGGGTVRHDMFPDLGERETGIEDVVDQEDMAALHVIFQLAAHLELPGGKMVRIGACGERVDTDRQFDAAQEVGGEEEPAVHHDDGGEFLSGIGARDIGGKLGNAAADRFRVVEGGECNGHRGVRLLLRRLS